MYPLHDIHQFQEMNPKLDSSNWLTWRREFLAIAKKRGLYDIIMGTDILPTAPNTAVTSTGGVAHADSDTASLAQRTAEWHDRNICAYNQILFCVSPHLQSDLDCTDLAATAWTILTDNFESTNPSRRFLVRMKYQNFHMVEGEPVKNYLATMNEYRNQLERMGEVISPSFHAVTILQNLPESWRSIAEAIPMLTWDVDEIEEKLEGHESFINDIEVWNQGAAAFNP